MSMIAPGEVGQAGEHERLGHVRQQVAATSRGRPTPVARALATNSLEPTDVA